MKARLQERVLIHGNAIGDAPDAARRQRIAHIPRAIRDRLRYGLVLQSVSDVAERIGIAIVPFYVFEESISDKLDIIAEPGLKPVSGMFLDYAEIERLCDRPECEELRLDREKLSGDGCRCFAFKHEGQVVAYMLCNFRECDSRLLSFHLKQGEVYLTGAFTFPAYRGKGLAAALECELYQHLNRMGYRRYHSINLLFNAPGLRFKKKLRSRPSEFRLYVSLFSRYRRNLTLRAYSNP